MSLDIRKFIHRIYGIALSAVTVIAGIRIALACYDIYTSGKAAGGQIYTRQAVAEAFAPIALSVYLCLALVIGGFLLHRLLPPQEKKAQPEKNRSLILSRLHAKTNLTRCDEALVFEIQREQKRRKCHWVISAALLALCSIGFMVYACLPGRWPDVAQVTAAIVPAVLVMLCCLAIPTGYAIFTAYYCRKSQDREIDLMKQAPREATLSPAPKAAKETNDKWMLMARTAIVVVAAAALLYGYFTGGIEDVVAKAAAICTECVGLG